MSVDTIFFLFVQLRIESKKLFPPFSRVYNNARQQCWWWLWLFRMISFLPSMVFFCLTCFDVPGLDVCVHQLYCGIEYIVHTLSQNIHQIVEILFIQNTYIASFVRISAPCPISFSHSRAASIVWSASNLTMVYFFPFRSPCIYVLRNIKNYEKYSPSLDGCCFAPVAWHEQKKERLREREWAPSTEHSTFTNGWNKKSSRLNSTMNYNSVA